VDWRGGLKGGEAGVEGRSCGKSVRTVPMRDLKGVTGELNDRIEGVLEIAQSN